VERDLDRLRAAAARVPESHRMYYTQERPLDVRTVDPTDPFRPERRDPRRYVWFRASEPLPGDGALPHQSVLAFASDYSILGTALLPHGLTFGPALQAATLDHAIWFHRPFRADEWLLYVTDSPSAEGALAFARGSVFTQDGRLVASVTQEGLLRVSK
jgi:acyl-CoA thioesterase II